MSVTEAKKHPVLGRFPLRRLKIPGSHGSVSLVVPDAFVWRRSGEWLQKMGILGEPPYWARIWPSSLAVIRLLGQIRALHGLRVLDLGCGLGLGGCVAASRGGAVVFADHDPDAVAFACWNANRAAAAGGAVQGVVGDWSVLDIGPFDIVILSDVTYEPRSRERLAACLPRLLARGGSVLHADPVREESTRFLRTISASMNIVETQRRIVWDGSSSMVRVCLACWRNDCPPDPGGPFACHLEGATRLDPARASPTPGDAGERGRGSWTFAAWSDRAGEAK